VGARKSQIDFWDSPIDIQTYKLLLVIQGKLGVFVSATYPRKTEDGSAKSGEGLKLYDSPTHSVAEITEATCVTKALYRAKKDREMGTRGLLST
jgi:hypothetical protein